MIESPELRAAWQELLADSRLADLAAAASGLAIHLVGGAVRDAGLGLPVHDLDVVVANDGHRIAKRLSVATGARLVALGGERFAALRLVSGDTHIDIWDLRNGLLVADLWRRDFTVNAIALSVPGGEIVDPTAGVDDLAHRRLRATRQEVFDEDPVRVLRLARLATTLPGFEVDAATAAWARAAAPRLAAAPHERVRVELDALLSQRRLSPTMRWLDALELPVLFFGKGSISPASTASSLCAAESVDRWREARASGTQALSEVPRQSPRSPLALHWTLLTGLFSASHTATMPRLRDLANRGLMTRACCEASLRLLVPAWKQPMDESTGRVWLHAAGPSWRDAIALRAARAESADEIDAWRQLEARLLAYADGERAGILDPPGLVSGDDVQRLLGIAPGPAVGAALARVRLAQVEGLVRSRQEAEELLLGGSASR